MNIVVVAICLCFVALYIYGYFKFPRNVAVLQTDLNRANTDMLLERQPIVFQDTPTLYTIRTKLFRFGIITEFALNPGVGWLENKYKYIAFETLADGEILACPPGKRLNGEPGDDEHLIALQCKKGNIVILPFRWKYNVNVPVACVGVHDLVTYFIP